MNKNNKGNKMKKLVTFRVVKLDDEYAVECRINGNYSEARTYFTDDHQDALDTMKEMKAEQMKADQGRRL